MNETYVGIDVSKDSLEVALRPSDHVQCFSNDEEGIAPNWFRCFDPSSRP
jgi:hypothetical protein